MKKQIEMATGFKNEIGDVLNIYQKPITGEDFEGKAMLIKGLAVWQEGERWLVEFEGEPNNYYERLVCEY